MPNKLFITYKKYDVKEETLLLVEVLDYTACELLILCLTFNYALFLIKKN